MPRLIWNLYKNDYQIGQCPSQIKALKALELHADRKIVKPRNQNESNFQDVYSQYYIRIKVGYNTYEARKETLQ